MKKWCSVNKGGQDIYVLLSHAQFSCREAEKLRQPFIDECKLIVENMKDSKIVQTDYFTIGGLPAARFAFEGIAPFMSASRSSHQYS